MSSRFEGIDSNIFSPSKPVQRLSGDTSLPFNLTVSSPSVINTENTAMINKEDLPLQNQPLQMQPQTESQNIQEENNIKAEEISKQEEEENTQQQQQEIEQPQPQQKKYSVQTDSSSLIKLPKDYSTDIFIEKQVIDYINSKNPEKWETKCENEKISVYQLFVSIYYIDSYLLYIYIYIHSMKKNVQL